MEGVQSAGSEAGKASTRKQQQRAAAGSSVEGTVKTLLRVGQSVSGRGVEGRRAGRLAGGPQRGRVDGWHDSSGKAQGGCQKALLAGKTAATDSHSLAGMLSRGPAPPSTSPSVKQLVGCACTRYGCATPQPPAAPHPCHRPQQPPVQPGGPCSCRHGGRDEAGR